MANDHKKSNQQMIVEQLQGQSRKLAEITSTLDNLFHHVAGFCRKLGIKPEELVELIHDTKANYTFLADCMKAEEALRKKRMEEMMSANAPSPETLKTLNDLAIKDNDILNEDTKEINTPVAAEAQQGKE